MNDSPILTLEVGLEEDVVLARQRARQVAALLGFDSPEQARIATATSEIVRNAVQHAGRARVEFLIDQTDEPPMLAIRVRDHGPGIGDVQAVLDGRSPSAPGAGHGIQAARRLMDRFAIESSPERGTIVRMAKTIPLRAGPVNREAIARFSDELARLAPRRLVEEVRQQDRELLRSLEELRDRQAELSQLNRELEETNRGVVALYAELDEKANSLRKVSELKTRFLSNMSHEFRSPLNSIVSLSGFLLGRSDGDLTPEQEKQVSFIRKAALVLSEMVNDLLDIAKVEAGKVVVRPESFEVADLFRTLRGMIRPLLTTDTVALVFEEPAPMPPLQTDEGKVAQVLRNFLSNALKFTECGEIRVRAEAGPGDTVVFSVADTGIGIAEADQARIFEEFGQVESPIQKRVKGTGLGLPLSRRLAELLGGTVSVRSAPGVGSTFLATIPRVYRGTEESEEARPRQATPVEASGRANHALEGSVLVIDDDEGDRYLLRGLLTDLGCRVIEATGGEEGFRRAFEERPRVVFLDMVMPDMSGIEVLERLKSNPATASIPVVIHSSKDLDDGERARLAALAVSLLSKGMPSREGVRKALAKAGMVAASAGLGGAHA